MRAIQKYSAKFTSSLRNSEDVHERILENNFLLPVSTHTTHIVITYDNRAAAENPLLLPDGKKQIQCLG